MSAVRSRDTRAEMALRMALRSRALTGYRCSPRGVPGRPDVAFTRWRVAVFVDGCFWHGCPECYVRPETNQPFWDSKLAVNKERDYKVDAELACAGWTVLRFWEHEVRSDPGSVADQVEDALRAAGRSVRPR
jgi:DNA mismatch endonuclease (patch repair protein)